MPGFLGLHWSRVHSMLRLGFRRKNWENASWPIRIIPHHLFSISFFDPEFSITFFPPFFLFAVLYMFTTPSKFSFHISSCEFVETTQRLSARDRAASKARTYMSTRSKAASRLASRLSVEDTLRLFPPAFYHSFSHDWPLEWTDKVHLNVSTVATKGIIFEYDLGNFVRHNIANSTGSLSGKCLLHKLCLFSSFGFVYF